MAWEEAGPGALGWTGASDESMREIASESFLVGLISREGTRVFAAEDGAEIIGFAVARREDRSAVDIAGIIVLESRTPEGAGSALLEAAVR